MCWIIDLSQALKKRKKRRGSGRVKLRCHNSGEAGKKNGEAKLEIGDRKSEKRPICENIVLP